MTSPEPDPEQRQRDVDPDAPGLAATRPLDDPATGNAPEPDEPG